MPLSSLVFYVGLVGGKNHRYTEGLNLLLPLKSLRFSLQSQGTNNKSVKGQKKKGQEKPMVWKGKPKL